MIPKFLTTKRFWIFECVATVLLSLNTILWLGPNIEAILLIALTFSVSNMIAWVISDKRVGSLCFLSWLFGGGAYVLDIVFIDWFKMSTQESYPLIIGSMLLAPLFAAINGVICLSVWIIVAKIYKCVEFKRTVAIILSCLGAIGAGICIGAGLYWWFFALVLIAIVSGWWVQRLLSSVSGSGVIWVYKSLDKKDWYQNGKPKPSISGNDYLAQLKTFLPFIQIVLFVFFAAVVGRGCAGRVNNKPQWEAEGLHGRICALQFTDKSSAIALSTLSNMYERTDTAIVYESVDGGKYWTPLLIVPQSTFFDNDFITIGNDLYSVLRQDSIYRIISVNIKSHKHHISTFIFDRYPIMFDNDGNIGILSNGRILQSDCILEHVDSIGEYSVNPAKYGYANFDNNIYGFVFDRQKSEYQLYDYSNGRIADSTSYSHNPHLVKLNNHEALIIGHHNDVFESDILTEFKYNIKTQAKHTIGRFGKMYVNGAIHQNDNSFYFLASEYANGPRYIFIIMPNDESWYGESAWDCNTNAYCVTDGYLYYYDQFTHEFHKGELQPPPHY